MRYEELTIEGRNAVLEAFRSGKTIDRLFVLDGCQDGPVRTIVREAKKHDTIVNFVPKERLDSMSETGHHQGVMAYAAAYEYAEVEDILKIAEEKGEPPFLFLLDGIEDPHNLGAIIRTANLCGRSRSDHSETPRGGTYCDGCENLRRCVKLYAGRKGHQYGGDHRGFKETRHLVRLRRHGWREHVPFKPHRTDRPCDWK